MMHIPLRRLLTSSVNSTLVYGVRFGARPYKTVLL